jgi:hypothetical protein
MTYRAQPNWEAQEAVKLDPSFADPHAGLGFLYVARGQLEEAAQELRAAKERSREPGGQVDIVGGEGKVVRCKDDGTCWRCFGGQERGPKQLTGRP